MGATQPRRQGGDRAITIFMACVAVLVMLSLAVIGYSISQSSDTPDASATTSQSQPATSAIPSATPRSTGDAAYMFAGGFALAFFISMLALGIAFYFLPTYVAVHYQHPEITRITLCNILFGWTGLGWLACFFWAVLPDQRELLKALAQHR